MPANATRSRTSPRRRSGASASEEHTAPTGDVVLDTLIILLMSAVTAALAAVVWRFA